MQWGDNSASTRTQITSCEHSTLSYSLVTRRFSLVTPPSATRSGNILIATMFTVACSGDSNLTVYGKYEI